MHTIYILLLIVYSSVPDEFDEHVEAYFKLNSAYFRRHGKAAECLAYQKKNGFKFKESSKTLILGVEGSGHHMLLNHFNGFVRITTEEEGVGFSYPSYMSWRSRNLALNRSIALNLAADSVPKIPRVRAFVKREYGVDELNYIVITRDPAAAKLSAMRRFMYYKETPFIEAIDRELEGFYLAMEIYARDISKLSCANTLFLSYELYLQYPNIHQGVLSSLGLEPIRTLRIKSAEPIDNSRLQAGMNCEGYYKKDLLKKINIYMRAFSNMTRGCENAKCLVSKIILQIHRHLAGNELLRDVTPRTDAIACTEES
eukprot:m.38216 g.38216  ORF g.38216 m.38216 type:complete len:313 (+) comp9408_c0_seq1:166-1104(+)